MSFREKMHWTSLIAILCGFGWYFISVFHGGNIGQGSHFGLLLLVIGGIITAMIIGAIIFAITNIRDANAVEDERDKIIHAKGTFAAYYILLLGIWCIIAAIYAGHNIFIIMHLLLGITIIAETIRIGTQLFYYRRGH